MGITLVYIDMQENLKSALQKAKYEPSGELKNRIWRKVVKQDRRVTYLKVTAFSVVSLTSLVGLIPMFKILINDFAHSGFYEYLSLAFSNNGLFSSYWKEFVYTLAESLPTMSIVFALGLLFVFLLSLRFVMKQIISNKYIGPSYGVA
jgi:hypothetical protein